MKKLLLSLFFALSISPALAQNPTCPTRPYGDNSNACASTAFVQLAIGHSSGSVSIISFGGDPTGVSDSTAAWNLAVASIGHCGQIYFPAGTYKFNSQLTNALTGAICSFSILGDGSDVSNLNWPTASGGIAITYANSSSSFHASNLSFLTGQAGGSTAINLTLPLPITTATGLATTTITNVTARGSDGYYIADYWDYGLVLQNVSYTQIYGFQVSGKAGTLGNGIAVAGTAGAPNVYSVVVDVENSTFTQLNVGFIYGPFVQGVTINQSNFTSVNYGVLASAAGGTLQQLNVTNSQMFAVTAGIAATGGAVLGNVQIIGNLVSTLGAAIDMPAANGTIVGNQFGCDTSAGSRGIKMRAGSGAIITNNTIASCGIGVQLDVGTQLIQTSSNFIFSSTTADYQDNSVTAPPNNNRRLIYAADISFPAIAQGDVLYGSAIGVLTSLPKSASSTRALCNTGAANIPAWCQIDLTTGVTSTLPVGNGGTGVTTFGGTNRLLYTTATDILSSITTANTSALVTNSTGVPGWTSGGVANRVLRTDGTTISFAQAAIATDVSGLGTGVATFLGTPSSANLAAALTDETGAGFAMFATSPSVTTDIRPVSDGGADLGTSALRWSTAFVNTITASGQAARTWSATRQVTAATAGTDLTIAASGAVFGGTDLKGGNLILSAGTSTGTGGVGGAGSAVLFYAAPSASGAGTNERAPVEVMRVDNYATFGVICFLGAACNTTNYAFVGGGATPNDTLFNAVTNLYLQIGIVNQVSINTTKLAALQTTASTSKTTGAITSGGGIGIAGATFTDTLNIITVANASTTAALCWNSGTGLVTENGAVGTCTVSDERLKNMGPRVTNALDKLLKIDGVYFTWKDPQYGNGRQIGVGAQTVEKVFPELVHEDGEGKKSADYQRLTAPIIEALRELNGRVQTLEKRRTK